MPIYQEAEKNAESLLTSTVHHKQDDSAYGKYVIQFNNKNTRLPSKKDTPNKTKTSGALFERKQKLQKLGNQQRAQIHFTLGCCHQQIKHAMSFISITSAVNLNLA